MTSKRFRSCGSFARPTDAVVRMAKISKKKKWDTRGKPPGDKKRQTHTVSRARGGGGALFISVWDPSPRPRQGGHEGDEGAFFSVLGTSSASDRTAKPPAPPPQLD